MGFQLLNGDCIEEMEKLIAAGVRADMILCDLPYDKTRAKWDAVVPFEPMWDSIRRISRGKDTAVVLFGNEPFSSLLRVSNLEMYRYDWKWLKTSRTTGFQNANCRPMSKYEDIMVFSEGTAAPSGKYPMKYYPQGLITVDKVKKNSAKRHGLITQNNANIGNSNVMAGESEYIQKYTNYPHNVLEFESDPGKALHPTQKPVSLLEYLIHTYTLSGETVLDFTMGSGSTGVASRNINREFIGIERDKKWFSVARSRLLD